MNEIKSRIDELVKDLKEERDELKLKLHLAKMEFGDEWEAVETKLAKLDSKARDLGNATSEASQDVVAAAKLLGQEIRDGLKSIGKRL